MPNQKGGSTSHLVTYMDLDKDNFQQVRYKGQICGPDLNTLNRNTVYTITNIRPLPTYGEITLRTDPYNPRESRIYVNIPKNRRQLNINCTRATGPNPTDISKELSLFTVVGDTRQRHRRLTSVPRTSRTSASRTSRTSASRTSRTSAPRTSRTLVSTAPPPPALRRSIPQEGLPSGIPTLEQIQLRLDALRSSIPQPPPPPALRRSTRRVRSTRRRPTIDESQLR